MDFELDRSYSSWTSRETWRADGQGAQGMNRLKIIFILMLLLPAESFASFSCVGGNCTVTCNGSSELSVFTGAMSRVSEGWTTTVRGVTCGVSRPAAYSLPKGFT